MKKIGGKQGVVYYGQCENGETLIIIWGMHTLTVSPDST